MGQGRNDEIMLTLHGESKFWTLLCESFISRPIYMKSWSRAKISIGLDKYTKKSR